MSKRIEEPEMAYVYVVRNPSYNDLSLCAWDNILYKGTNVVYETKFGLDLGVIVGPAPVSRQPYRKGSCDVDVIDFSSSDNDCSSCSSCCVSDEPVKVEVKGDVDYIDHLATPQEMKRYEENSRKEEAALRVCREKVVKNKLNMKLVTAHFLLAENKVIFFFTAEERVDFRDLVKDLVQVFKMRIELRQIGVRDESRLLGGLSVCGRDYCCHCINTQMDPVTIKMAKEQNLSLNSMKISGSCGRLLCCLAYEYDYYMEEKAGCPQEGTRLRLGRDLWKVVEVNILSRKLTLEANEGRTMFLPFEDVYYDDDTSQWHVSQDFIDEFLE